MKKIPRETDEEKRDNGWLASEEFCEELKRHIVGVGGLEIDGASIDSVIDALSYLGYLEVESQ